MNTHITKKTGHGQSVTSRFFLVMMFAWILSIAGYSTCFAATVTLSWDPNTEATLAGYKVYYKADTSTLPFNGTGAVEGASPINVNNQTTATVSGLDPTKTYYFAVTSYDTSGVESSYSNIVTVLELYPPTTAITAPVNNSTVSGIVSVVASASDNVSVTKLEFYVNGILQATDTATPYVYSWNTSSLASGTYTLMTKAYDAAGNVGQSSNVAVAIVNDITAPTVSLTAPANGATLSGVVSVTASASDNVGVSKVEFYNNGTLLFAGNVAPYTYNWNTNSIANGNYTLTARAYDNVGNIGQSSSVSVTVFNDSTAPTVTAFSIPATASFTTVAITSLTASDNVGVTGYLVTESATAPAAGAAGWTASVPTSFTFAADGSRTAYAWARDAAGNVSSSRSASVTITLPDTTLPTISITSPANNATISGSVSVVGAASDNIGVSKVEFYLNNVLQSSSSTAPYSFNWNTTSVVNGIYTLFARAYDAAGNAGQSTSINVAVNNAVITPGVTYTAVFGNASGADYPGTVQDTFLNINNEVNASNMVLNTYTWPENTPANAILMKWDISALPANAQIQSATLSLSLTGSGGDASYEIPVSQIINKQPVIANSNGNTYDGINSWTASSVPYGGIPLAQSDIGPVVDAPIIDNVYGYKNWNVTNIVKDWMVTPSNNLGLLLNSSNKASSDSNRIFASSEAVDATQRPKLVVTYTLPDTTAPVVSAFSMPATATVLSVPVSSLTATDNVGVTGYLVTESATAPAAGATGWTVSIPTSFTFAADGSRTAYAWARDAAGNVSSSRSASVTITLPDTTTPVVSAFSMPATATVLSVPVSSLTATDNVGVTGYLITESATAPAAGATGWTASVPTSFIFSAAGSRTAYAWARDAAGNVSAARNSSVIITLPDTTLPTISITSPANNATISGSVSVVGAASDNIGVSKVEFYLNNVLQSSSSTAPYSFNWNTTSVVNGIYTLFARAYDAAGNASQSTSINVAVNNAVITPEVTYTAVFGNASGADYPGTVQDTFLNINNEVNASSTMLNTYTWPENKPANAILMKWDISALPANAQIQSATLSLSLTGSGGDASYEIPVSQIINKQPVIANSNGNTYDGINSWTASSVPYGGIPLAQSDIGPVVDAPIIDNAYGYKNWNVTNIVKDWMVTPGNNLGLLLNSSNKASSDSNRIFASSEAVDATQRPKLVVTYTLPSATLPSGNIDGYGGVDLTDVLLALQIAVGKVTATSDQLVRGDVAPVVNGISQPNGKIDIADVIVILGKVVGI